MTGVSCSSRDFSRDLAPSKLMLMMFLIGGTGGSSGLKSDGGGRVWVPSQVVRNEGDIIET